MLRKLLLTTSIIAATISSAYAVGPCTGSAYVGFGFGVQTNTSKISNFRGMPVSLFAGYGADMGQGFYLAGEIFVTPVTANISNNGLRSTYNYGISIIPGLMLSDHTMFYGRVGILRTHFIPTFANSATVTGGQLGLGIETSLTQNWDLRGEYDFVASKSLGGSQGSPRSDIATLGLVYKFD